MDSLTIKTCQNDFLDGLKGSLDWRIRCLIWHGNKTTRLFTGTPASQAGAWRWAGKSTWRRWGRGGWLIAGPRTRPNDTRRIRWLGWTPHGAEPSRGRVEKTKRFSMNPTDTMYYSFSHFWFVFAHTRTTQVLQQEIYLRIVQWNNQSAITSWLNNTGKFSFRWPSNSKSQDDRGRGRGGGDYSDLEQCKRWKKKTSTAMTMILLTRTPNFFMPEKMVVSSPAKKKTNYKEF